MALMNCNECGGDVSDKALFCPKCGAPDFKPIESETTNKLTNNISIWMVLASVMFPIITPAIYSFTKALSKKKIQSWACSIAMSVIVIAVNEQSSPSYKTVYMSPDNFNGTWPFTVSEGYIGCRLGMAVIFSSEGIDYGVNGFAKSNGYTPLINIRLDAPEGYKIDYGNMIEVGLSLCN